MRIKKANGEMAAFDENKIRHSLKRANASDSMIETVVDQVKMEMFDGISSSGLYRIVFRELKKLKKGIAGKYNLKRAIMSMGPTGFPFEEFVAAIWKAEGNTVETGVFVKGDCVKHEVDVVAKRNGMIEFDECKHSSSSGQVCSIKNTLYFYARFLDLEKGRLGQTVSENKGWLVTNMRFSSEAIAYGNCVGLGLLSWDYPKGNSLRERIEKAGLHPITCLSSLSKKQTQELMSIGITLCSEMLRSPEVLEKVGIRGIKAERVRQEASDVCDS